MPGNEENNKDLELQPVKKHVNPKAMYNLYWDYIQKSRYGKSNNIAELYHGCEMLVTAAVLGDSEARAEVRSNALASFLAHEFQQATEAEFNQRLNEIHQNERQYSDAQNTLFILNYSKKYQSVYSDYTERYQQLFQALSHLSAVGLNANENLIKFADLMGFKLPFNYAALKAYSWKLLLNEMIGIDPLLATIKSSEEQGKITSSYPFRVMSKQKFKETFAEIFVNNVSGLEDLATRYESHIQENITKIRCFASRAGSYRFTISAEQLKSRDHTTVCFMDPHKGIEIARFELNDNALYFKGHGDAITLCIRDEIAFQSCIIENKGSTIELESNLTTEESIYFAVTANKITYSGNVSSSKVIKFDVKGELDFSNLATVESLENIEIRADECVIDGKLHSSKEIHTDIKKCLTITHNASCEAELDVVLNAGALKEVRGKVISQKRLVAKIADGIDLRGSAELEGKLGVLLSANSLISRNKSSIKSPEHIECQINNKLIIEDTSTWHAKQCKYAQLLPSYIRQIFQLTKSVFSARMF